MEQRTPPAVIVRGMCVLMSLVAAPCSTLLADFDGAPVLFVDASLATGGNNGSSWANAFQGRLGLQAALTAVGNGRAQIWAADGEYSPAPPNGDRNASFHLKTGVEIYGGFAGGETALDQRDPAAHPTIITGDLNDNDDDTGHDNENSYHVVRAVDCEPSAVLDGFVVEAGRANWSPPNDTGANMFITGGGPTIVNCLVRRGWAYQGGGAAVMQSAPALTRCTFMENTAQGYGSGVFHTHGSAATFEDCRFQENIGGHGAGLFNGLGDGVSRPIIRRCQFLSNIGEIGAASGIGMFDWNGEPLIEACVFIDNHTGAGGGGMYLGASNARVINCLFAGNVGMFDGGGAVYVDGGFFFPDPPKRPGSPVFVNCHMVGNNGAVLCTFEGHADLINCTIAHNSLMPQSWPTFFVGNDSLLHLSNSIVWGNPPVSQSGLAGVFFVGNSGNYVVDHGRAQFWNGSLPGTGTTSQDPMFADAAGIDGVLGTEDDDPRLQPASPCIDAGDNAAVPADIADDFLGQPRFVDDPRTPDGGVGTPPMVDIGAVEFQPPITPGDITGDGIVDVNDLLAVIGAWGPCPAPCPADLNGDRVVDVNDLLQVVANWD